mgnify:CR=1 FL=1
MRFLPLNLDLYEVEEGLVDDEGLVGDLDEAEDLAGAEAYGFLMGGDGAEVGV